MILSLIPVVCCLCPLLQYGSLADGTMVVGASDMDALIIVDQAELPSITETQDIIADYREIQLEKFLQRCEDYLRKWDYVMDVFHYRDDPLLNVRLRIDNLEIDLDLQFTSDIIKTEGSNHTGFALREFKLFQIHSNRLRNSYITVPLWLRWNNFEGTVVERTLQLGLQHALWL